MSAVHPLPFQEYVWLPFLERALDDGDIDGARQMLELGRGVAPERLVRAEAAPLLRRLPSDLTWGVWRDLAGLLELPSAWLWRLAGWRWAELREAYGDNVCARGWPEDCVADGWHSEATDLDPLRSLLDSCDEALLWSRLGLDWEDAIEAGRAEQGRLLGVLVDVWVAAAEETPA